MTYNGDQLMAQTIANGIHVVRSFRAERVVKSRMGVNTTDSWGLVPNNVPFKADPVTAMAHDVLDHVSTDDGTTGFECAAVMGTHSWSQGKPKRRTIFGFVDVGPAAGGLMQNYMELEKDYEFVPLGYVPRSELAWDVLRSVMSAEDMDGELIPFDVRARYAPWAAFGVDAQQALWGSAHPYKLINDWIYDQLTVMMGRHEEFEDRKADYLDIELHGKHITMKSRVDNSVMEVAELRL